MEGRDEIKGSKPSFPVSFWEVTVASTVVMGFVLGLIGVYLTMPASDYSFLKLPRSLEDLQILRFVGSLVNLEKKKRKIFTLLFFLKKREI